MQTKQGLDGRLLREQGFWVNPSCPGTRSMISQQRVIHHHQSDPPDVTQDVPLGILNQGPWPAAQSLLFFFCFF